MAQPADFNYTMGKSSRGVCGNFRFRFFDITNCDDYASIVPVKGPVTFACSTNTGANTDVFGTGPMNVEGTADANVANELKDTSETFSSMWSGLRAINESTKASCLVSCKDADELYCFNPTTKAAADTFPNGNEAWNVTSDRHVELTSAGTTYEGYLIVFGK